MEINMTQHVNVIKDAVVEAGIRAEHVDLVTAHLERIREEATGLARTMYVEKMRTQSEGSGVRNYFTAIASAAFGNNLDGLLTYRSSSYVVNEVTGNEVPGVTASPDDRPNPVYNRKDPMPFRFMEAPEPTEQPDAWDAARM
jgi:hypothetical protein